MKTKLSFNFSFFLFFHWRKQNTWFPACNTNKYPSVLYPGGKTNKAPAWQRCNTNETKKRNKWITAARAIQDIEISSGRALHSQEVTATHKECCPTPFSCGVWVNITIHYVVHSVYPTMHCEQHIIWLPASQKHCSWHCVNYPGDSLLNQSRSRKMDEFVTKKPKKQTKSPAVEDAAAKKTFCQNWPTRVIKYEAAYA